MSSPWEWKRDLARLGEGRARERVPAPDQALPEEGLAEFLRRRGVGPCAVEAAVRALRAERAQKRPGDQGTGGEEQAREVWGEARVRAVNPETPMPAPEREGKVLRFTGGEESGEDFPPEAA